LLCPRACPVKRRLFCVSIFVGVRFMDCPKPFKKQALLAVANVFRRLLDLAGAFSFKRQTRSTYRAQDLNVTVCTESLCINKNSNQSNNSTMQIEQSNVESVLMLSSYPTINLRIITSGLTG
jgi:hypothetical protein